MTARPEKATLYPIKAAVTKMITDLKKNVVLIGMPGAGKSTLGVLLAKALGMGFVDTDLLIQQHEGKLLQEIIDAYGLDKFMLLEESVVAEANIYGSVIATGGSVVYSEKAMSALKKNGTVVYLDVEFSELERRLTNITTRGIVLKDGFTLKDLFDERLPLYRKYADITVKTGTNDIEESLAEVKSKLQAGYDFR
jgi:shikimate kinase